MLGTLLAATTLVVTISGTPPVGNTFRMPAAGQNDLVAITNTGSTDAFIIPNGSDLIDGGGQTTLPAGYYVLYAGTPGRWYTISRYTAGVADGDKGDILVSGGGATWAYDGIVPDQLGGTGSDSTVLAADRVFVTTGGAYTPFRILDCDDVGGQHLNYNDSGGGGPTFSCGTSSGGSGNSVEASIAITSAGTYFTTTVAAAWVAAGTEIVCRPFGTAADGLTPEAITVSGVQATVIDRVAGVSFDLAVNNPNGLEGTVRFHCLGV